MKNLPEEIRAQLISNVIIACMSSYKKRFHINLFGDEWEEDNESNDRDRSSWRDPGEKMKFLEMGTTSES